MVERPDLITTEDMYRLAGRSLADYLGYPSFTEYLRRTNYFYAELTVGSVEEQHLGELFQSVGDEVEYDKLIEKLFTDLKPVEGSEGIRGFFDRNTLVQSFRSNEFFVSADGDCKLGEASCRLQASCELHGENGKVFGLFLINDISDLYDPHSLARKYAEYDPLTKLFSRHAADAYGKEYFSLHPDDHAAIVMVEVDRFKDFNDRYGHHIGDIVLKEIARELEEDFPNAIIGRNAGQEFLVLLKDRSDKEVEEAVKSFSEKEHSLSHEGETYHYSFSVGYCLYPEQGILYHDLARKADKAKYNIRLGGGDNYCKFEDEMLTLNNF